MSPHFFVNAGANGSGKSFFSDQFLYQSGYKIESFDFDLEFDKRWSRFGYDPLVEEGIRETTSEFFIESYEKAISEQFDFAYQTNYHTDQSGILELFKSAGYITHLIYFFVDDVDILRSRISFRHERKNLHNVADHVILERYEAGLTHLDDTHQNYHHVLILDNLKNFFDPGVEQVPEAVYLREDEYVEVSEACRILRQNSGLREG